MTTPKTQSATTTLAELLDALQGAVGTIEAKGGVLHFQDGRAIDLTTLTGMPDPLVAEKAQALDSTLSQLTNMGFGSDDPINGGDCVESVDQIYQGLVHKFKRKAPARA